MDLTVEESGLVVLVAPRVVWKNAMLGLPFKYSSRTHKQQESTGESGGMAIWEAGVKGKCSVDNGVAGKTSTMTTGRPGLR